MLIKYRVNEVAKDFGKTTKDITSLLAKYIDTPKKSMTALEEDELDLIFEYFTQQSEVENFDAYFATAEQRKEKSAESPKTEEAPAAEKQQERAKTGVPGAKLAAPAGSRRSSLRPKSLLPSAAWWIPACLRTLP